MMSGRETATACSSDASDLTPEYPMIPAIPATVANASPRGQRACTMHPRAINRTASRADNGHDVVAVMSATTEPLDCDCDGLCKAEIRNVKYTTRPQRA